MEKTTHNIGRIAFVLINGFIIVPVMMLFLAFSNIFREAPLAESGDFWVLLLTAFLYAFYAVPGYFFARVIASLLVKLSLLPQRVPLYFDYFVVACCVLSFMLSCYVYASLHYLVPSIVQ